MPDRRLASSSRPPRRRSALVLLALICAVAVTAVAAVTATGASERSPRAGTASAERHMPAEVEAARDRMLDEQIARDERRRSPEARAQRKRTRTAFAELAPDEAIQLGRQAFREQLASKPWKGVELPDGQRIERYLGERAARVARPGKPDAIMQSTLPLRADDEQGRQAPVDLTLRDAGAHLESVNPLAPVVFSKDPREGATLERGGVSVALVGVDEQAVVEEEGDRVVVPEALVDTDAWMAPRPGGFQTFATLRSAASPEQLVYRVGMPAGAELRVVPGGGGGEVVRDGKAIAAIGAPIAWDADGKEVAVSLGVAGDRLILEVPHREEDLRYPLLVDPYVAEAWNWHNGSSGYDGWVTSATDPGTFDGALLDLPHRWGRGLYVFTRNGSWVPEDATAGWDFQAPGQTSYVYYGSVELSHAPNSSCAAVGIDAGDDVLACTSLSRQSFYVCGVTCNSWAGTPGAELYAELFATYGMNRTDQNKALAAVTAATAYYSDSDLPDLSGVTGGAPPAGWVRSWAGAVEGSVKDTGLGVGGLGVELHGAAWGTDDNSLECLGTTQDPCPAEVPLYEIIDTSHPDLAGWQVEGRHAVKVFAADMAYNAASRVLGELKLDRSGPAVTLGGGLWNARVQGYVEPTLAPGAHNLTIQAADGATDTPGNERSGTRSIEVLVDNETVLAPNDVACPGSSCGMTRQWSLATAEFPAGKHTVKVIAQDHAGNQTTTTFEVKVPPAGELTWPGPGQATSRWLPIQAHADASGYTGVRFQYRKPLTGWTDIPASALLDDAGQPVSSVNQPLTNNLSPKLNWDLTAMATLLSGTYPQTLDVRAVFGGGQGGTSRTVKVSYDPRGLSTDDAQQDVGVGAVNLVTGNLSVSTTDASVSSWLAPITVSRTLNSRDPGTNADGPFGPGWVAATPVEGVADYVSLSESTDTVYGNRTAAVKMATGAAISFWEAEQNEFVPEETYPELRLVKPAADRYELFDDDGSTVVFRRQEGTTDEVYVPVEVRQPGSANRSAMVYEVVAGKPRVARLLAPSPAGVDCGANHNARGCRSLTLVYATTTTASGTAEAGWGSYLGRVERIELTAYDPATSAMRTDTVSRYLYDGNGRLRAQWDPRISPALKQRYGYDLDGRLTLIVPSSGPAVSLAYQQLASDQDPGRLASVSRPTPHGTATTTLVYDVPVSGPSAPYPMGAADVAAWAQNDVPFSATAVFPPDAVPTSSPPASYERATLHYLNRSGREVNAVTPGGGTTTSEYDRYGNVIRSLSPSNRARALASGGLSAQVAQRLDSQLDYADEGLELVEELGPEREVKLNSGVVVQARQHTETDYDEGAPSGMNPHLPTTVTMTAKLANGSDADYRIAKHQYDWNLRASTVTRTDPGPLGLDIWHQRGYHSDTGLQWAEWPPDGHATRLTYYYRSTATHSDCYGRPEWENLPCRTTRENVASELPAPPTRRFFYNRLGQPTKIVETSESLERTTTKTYDDAGRELTSRTAANTEAMAPVVALGFEEASGTAATDSSGSGNHGTVEGGAVRVADGRFGRALRFDGNDDRVRVADDATLDLPGAMTLQAWVRPDVIAGEVRNVITRGSAVSGCSAPNYALMASASATSATAVGRWCGVSAAGSSSGVGRWTHLAVTKEGTALRFFVNGSQVHQVTSSTGAVDGVGDLLVGDGAGGQFSGLIDEVRVYDRALTATEIGADMKRPVADDAAPAPAPLSDLRAAYSFEEAPESETVEDASPNGNDGTYAAMRTPSGRHGAGAIGPNALVPDSDSLDVSTGVTLEAWMSFSLFGPQRLVIDKWGAYSLGVYGMTGSLQAVFTVQVGGLPKSLYAPFAVGKPQHVAGTYDGQTMRLYVDGVQKATRAVTGPVNVSTGDLDLGYGNDEFVDEVRIFGRALSATEVADEMNRPVANPRRLRGAGTPVPTVTQSYDAATGLPTTTSTTEDGVTRTITKGYDTMGRVTSYTDADGNTSTTSYDLLGRPTSVSDGKGTQSFDYDPITGALTELEDSQAGTFTASYDVEGKLIAQDYPNGLRAETLYDETGAPTDLAYTKQDCTSNCVWFEEHVQESVFGQWRTRDSSLSDQVYDYDVAGRLTQVRDMPTGQGCTTRTYELDPNSNRTSRTERAPGAGGACDVSSPGQVQEMSYDITSRVTTDGFEYDQFSRLVAVPGTHSGGDQLHTAYYLNDMVRSQTQGNVTKGWLLDPTQSRYRASVPSGTVQEVMHYSDDSDSPAWTAVVDDGVEQSWERTVTGIDGGLAAVVSDDGEDTTVELQLANLHGDITATASTDDEATAPTATFESDEFGNPRQGDAKKYGWLGAKERRSVLPSGVVQMGVRSYVPEMGRFTSIDPVVGGSANDYDYSNADPVNQVDLTGMVPGWIKDAASYVRAGVDKYFGKYEPWAPLGDFHWNQRKQWRMKETCLFGAAIALFSKNSAKQQARKCLTPAAQIATFGTTWFGALVQGIKDHGTQIRCTWTGLQEAPCVRHDYTKKEPQGCGPQADKYVFCGDKPKRKRRR